MAQVAKYTLCNVKTGWSLDPRTCVKTEWIWHQVHNPSPWGAEAGAPQRKLATQTSQLFRLPGSARGTAGPVRQKAMEVTAVSMSGLHRHACVQMPPSHTCNHSLNHHRKKKYIYCSTLSYQNQMRLQEPAEKENSGPWKLTVKYLRNEQRSARQFCITQNTQEKQIKVTILVHGYLAPCWIRERSLVECRCKGKLPISSQPESRQNEKTESGVKIPSSKAHFSDPLPPIRTHRLSVTSSNCESIGGLVHGGS